LKPLHSKGVDTPGFEVEAGAAVAGWNRCGGRVCVNIVEGLSRRRLDVWLNWESVVVGGKIGGGSSSLWGVLVGPVAVGVLELALEGGCGRGGLCIG